MPKYVDGYVIPIKAANEDAYRRVAEFARDIWMEHGALDYVECIGDDLAQESLVSFKALSGAAEDENVIFAYIVYESREHRDAVNAKVAADPRMADCLQGEAPPFDMKRIAFGGFRSIVSVGG